MLFHGQNESRLESRIDGLPEQNPPTPKRIKSKERPTVDCITCQSGLDARCYVSVNCSAFNGLSDMRRLIIHEISKVVFW